ncbi:MAG TPA: cupin domain-containing protein [Rhizomicrobium sp.]|nr:cupin domain-containing protein [Rhizomicrobium sp.]
MTPITKVGLTALAIAAGSALVVPAGAQYAAPARPPIANPETTVNDPPGPVPLAANIPFTPYKDFKWSACNGPCRNQTVNLWGNPNQPGPYGVLIKWYPGTFSAPHQHDKTRWIYVVEGTWWVSTSNVQDVKTTYPMRAGTFIVHEGGKTHWDGTRLGGEPATILLTGIGPVVTTQIGPDGNPLVPAPGPGAAGGRGN